MSGHIFKAFDADLAAVRDRVMSMSDLVKHQLQLTKQVLTGGSADLAAQIEANKQTLAGMQVAIDADCTRFITLRQPCAGDLRVILTFSKVINDLDRVGKKARKIARTYQLLAFAVPVQVNLLHQLELSIHMFDAAILALVQGDKRAAAKIAHEDALLNEEFRSIKRQMVALMMEEPSSIEQSLQITEVAKAIERVGDHSRNIAEYVVYLVDGLDVRHQTADAIAEVTA